MGGSTVRGKAWGFLFLRRPTMNKKLSQFEHEDLIIANERIEVASKALIMFDNNDFQAGGFDQDIAQIIQVESDKIQSIIGSYNEFSKAVENSREGG
jgi:hypothetical protein